MKEHPLYGLSGFKEGESLMPEPVIHVVAHNWLDSDCPRCGTSCKVFRDGTTACVRCVNNEHERLSQGAVRSFLLGNSAFFLPVDLLSSLLEQLHTHRDEDFPSGCSGILDRLLYVVVLKLVRDGEELPILRETVMTFFHSNQIGKGVAGFKSFVEDLTSLR